MNKRNQAILIIALLSMTIFAGCGTSTETIEITKEGTFSESQCKAHNPNYEVIMIESKFCGHCKETLPKFLEACAELGVVPVVLDMAKAEDAELAEEKYKVSIRYTPTFIFGCDYLVGAQPSKEDYSSLIKAYQQYQ
ncbi:thioredoxin family protein [Candidatus Woesearchaeota archaeon]|nr:thioredoxin family protein [Candidatus Woesearchaeota archaeon]